MLLALFGEKEMLGDLQLLFGEITGDVYHLHTVQQGRLYRRNAVGGSDEQHLGEVIVQIQVVIVESSVLLGIEGFQQGGRRVTLEVGSELVYLVQHHHGVRGAGLGDTV